MIYQFTKFSLRQYFFNIFFQSNMNESELNSIMLLIIRVDLPQWVDLVSRPGRGQSTFKWNPIVGRITWQNYVVVLCGRLTWSSYVVDQAVLPHKSTKYVYWAGAPHRPTAQTHHIDLLLRPTAQTYHVKQCAMLTLTIGIPFAITLYLELLPGSNLYIKLSVIRRARCELEFPLFTLRI